MFKVIVAAVLLMAASTSIADTTSSVDVTSSAKMPVIVKNEPVSATMCRLHFEDGSQKEVACVNTTEKAS